MPTSTSTLVTTCKAMAGGVDEVAPRGATYRITFSGTWLPNESWLFSIVSTIGDMTLGFGNITGAASTNGYVHQQKVYLADGRRFCFSAVGDPTGWEQQNAGAGTQDYTTQYGAVDTVQGFSDYQGKLAVLGRRSAQIWDTDPDPLLYSLFQTLPNTGTFAGFSVTSQGDLDVFYLSDTGVRSLRAKETTLNAFVNDLGSPIDRILQETITILTATEKATCCGVMEPTANRFLLFVPNSGAASGYIYVLSYFPSNKIQAWSRYNATTQITDGSFDMVTTDYDEDTGAGFYSGLIPGETYTWTKGANDISITSGSTTRTTSGTFVAQSSIATCTGIPGAISTATLTGPKAMNFVPQKFVVRNGQVYVRTATTVLLYGGLTGLVYDGIVAIIQVPFIDLKRPGHRKLSSGVDIALDGTWDISASSNWINGTMSTVVEGRSTSTFDQGAIPFQAEGTHFSIKAITTGQTAARISALMLHYQLADQQSE